MQSTEIFWALKIENFQLKMFDIFLTPLANCLFFLWTGLSGISSFGYWKSDLQYQHISHSVGYPYVVICCWNTFFENRISFSSVIDVTAANDLCLNGNRRQTGQKCCQGLSWHESLTKNGFYCDFPCLSAWNERSYGFWPLGK